MFLSGTVGHSNRWNVQAMTMMPASCGFTSDAEDGEELMDPIDRLTFIGSLRGKSEHAAIAVATPTDRSSTPIGSYSRTSTPSTIQRSTMVGISLDQSQPTKHQVWSHLSARATHNGLEQLHSFEWGWAEWATIVRISICSHYFPRTHHCLSYGHSVSQHHNAS
jgi:hypothetical protein